MSVGAVQRLSRGDRFRLRRLQLNGNGRGRRLVAERCAQRKRPNMLRGIARITAATQVSLAGRCAFSSTLPAGSATCLAAIVEQQYASPMDYRERITIEPGKRGGKPCLRGLRITAYDVLDYLAGGMSEDEILADFPDLEREDIRAALAFAADRERRLAGDVAA